MTKIAFIGAAIFFLVLGLLCTRMGRDGVMMGVAIILCAIALFTFGLIM